MGAGSTAPARDAPPPAPDATHRHAKRSKVPAGERHWRAKHSSTLACESARSRVAPCARKRARRQQGPGERARLSARVRGLLGRRGGVCRREEPPRDESGLRAHGSNQRFHSLLGHAVARALTTAPSLAGLGPAAPRILIHHGWRHKGPPGTLSHKPPPLLATHNQPKRTPELWRSRWHIRYSSAIVRAATAVRTRGLVTRSQPISGASTLRDSLRGQEGRRAGYLSKRRPGTRSWRI